MWQKNLEHLGRAIGVDADVAPIATSGVLGADLPLRNASREDIGDSGGCGGRRRHFLAKHEAVELLCSLRVSLFHTFPTFRRGWLRYASMMSLQVW